MICFIRLALIILATFFGSASLDMAIAQPLKTAHPMVKSKAGDANGADAVQSKEAEDKNAQNPKRTK